MFGNWLWIWDPVIRIPKLHGEAVASTILSSLNFLIADRALNGPPSLVAQIYLDIVPKSGKCCVVLSDRIFCNWLQLLQMWIHSIKIGEVSSQHTGLALPVIEWLFELLLLHWNWSKLRASPPVALYLTTSSRRSKPLA